MPRRMHRRAFIVGGAALVAGFASVRAAPGGEAASAPPRPVYRVYQLDPKPDPAGGNASVCTRRGGCAGCRACRRHAANKLFVSAAAADAGRAHPHCKCRVVSATLPAAAWAALFGGPVTPRRLSVDRRQAAVRAVLAPGDA